MSFSVKNKYIRGKIICDFVSMHFTLIWVLLYKASEFKAVANEKN